MQAFSFRIDTGPTKHRKELQEKSNENKNKINNLIFSFFIFGFYFYFWLIFRQIKEYLRLKR